MCLNLPDISHFAPEPLVAEEDIVCYKVLRRVRGLGFHALRITWASPYQQFVYKFGKTYNAQMECEYRYQDIRNRTGSGYLWRVEEGLHTLVNREDAEEYIWGDVFTAIIPKGAKYYVGHVSGNLESYASDTLIVLNPKHPLSLKAS